MKLVLISVMGSRGLAFAGMTLAGHILARGDEPILLGSQPIVDEVREMQKESPFLNAISEAELCDSMGLWEQRQIEYIAWDHSDGVNYCLDHVCRLLDSGAKLELSFYTDGFAPFRRADIPPRVLSELKNQARKVVVGSYYFFFSSLDAVVSANLSPELIDASHLRNLVETLSSRTDVQQSIKTFFSSIPQTGTRELTIILMRPWCTDFHGTLYQFGRGPKSLAEIVEGIISLLSDGGKRDLNVIAKTDGRYELFQDAALELANPHELHKFKWSVGVPQLCRSAEILYAGLLSHMPYESHVTFVSFDSSAPLSLCLFSGNATFVIGAARSDLIEAGANESQIEYISKYSNLVRDVTERLLAQEGRLMGIELQTEGIHFVRSYNGEVRE